MAVYSLEAQEEFQTKNLDYGHGDSGRIASVFYEPYPGKQFRSECCSECAGTSIVIDGAHAHLYDSAVVYREAFVVRLRVWQYGYIPAAWIRKRAKWLVGAYAFLRPCRCNDPVLDAVAVS